MGKKKAKRKSKKGLAGVAQAGAANQGYAVTAKEALFMLAAAIAAGGAGAAIGKHSFFAGIPVTVFGVHKQNKYIIAAGLGLVLSNGFQKQAATAATTTTTTDTASAESVEGFDFKLIAEQAKDRVGTFFKNFGEKLYLPKSEGSTTEGLGDDQVSYFVNPYSNKELDLSAIDRIQEQVAQMSQPTYGLNETDREF
jgi:hypothetical protein